MKQCARIFAIGALGWLVVPSLGCGGAATPQRTVQEYRNAIRSNSPGKAHALLSTDARLATPNDRFLASFQRRVDAGRPLLDQLEHATNADAHLTATLQYSRYERVEMELVEGRWVITSGLGELYSQSSPRATATSFIRSVQANDAQALLRLVPAEYRTRMSVEDMASWLELRADELAETIALLELHLDQPIGITGTNATLRYGVGEMTFVLEGGRWMIENFH